MNQGMMLHLFENTAMTGAPSCTFHGSSSNNTPHASKIPTDAFASTYDDNNPIKLRRISSLGLVEFADVTSLGLSAAAVVACTFSCITYIGLTMLLGPTGLQNMGKTKSIPCKHHLK
jgi:hypothetical protein